MTCVVMHPIRYFFLIIKFYVKRLRYMMFDQPEERKKLPAEIYEIAEKIASGKPKIDWDYISDWFIHLWNQEQEAKKKPKKDTPKDKPKARRTRRVSIE